MINASDKFDYYAQLKRIFTSKGFSVNPYREIDYGIQFLVFLDDDDALIRVYESKKGIKLDLSQVKNESIRAVLDEFAEPVKTKQVKIKLRIGPNSYIPKKPFKFEIISKPDSET